MRTGCRHDMDIISTLLARGREYPPKYFPNKGPVMRHFDFWPEQVVQQLNGR